VNNQKPRRIKVENPDDFIALDDFIIIEAHESQEVTKGGIILSDKAKENSWRGTVIAVGPGKYDSNGKRQRIWVEPGDVLIYRNFMGWKMAEIDGKKYYAVSGEERIAKIPKSKVQYE